MTSEGRGVGREGREERGRGAGLTRGAWGNVGDR